MRYLLLIFFFVSTFTLFSQEAVSIKGVVSNERAEAIEGATIRVFSVDSVFLSGTTTDVKGGFALKVKHPECFFEITCLGYRKLYRTFAVVKAANEYNIGTITLKDASIAMDEVTVTGRAAALQVKGDTLEYTTGIYNLAEHVSVQDLLKLLPNVSVTNDGRIMVQGKVVSKILVDGKEFFTTDLEMASKSLPGKIVDKVQVIDRSTEQDRLSGFDSGDKETVLNLDIKEENKVGITLQATVGGGHDINGEKTRYGNRAYANVLKKQDMYNLSVENSNTNMGAGQLLNGEMTNNAVVASVKKSVSKQLDLFANISYNSLGTVNETKTEAQTILSPESSLYDNSDNSTDNKQRDLTFFTRAEWNPNEQNTFIVNARLGYARSNNTGSESFGSFGTARDTLYDGHSVREGAGDGYSVHVDADYAYRLKKKGRVLSASVQGTLNRGDSHETYAWNRRTYEDNTYMRDSVVNQQAYNENSDRQFNLRLSYVEPVGKNRFMQIAYNIRSAESHADKTTYNTWNDVYDLLASQSPSTRQESFYQRFTLNYRSVGKKTEYTMGVNVDLDDSENSTYLPNDTVRASAGQTVTNYSPVLNVKHRFGKNKQLVFNYMGNMTSPSARQLQDYTDISNPINSIKGNPGLKLQFVNSGTLNFTGSSPKSQSFFYANMRGQYTMNAIQPAVTINPATGNRLTTYKNMNGNWNLAAQANYNLPIRNTRFTVGNNISTGYERRKGIINDGESTTGTFALEEQPSILYNGQDFNCQFRGLFRYMAVKGQSMANDNMKTYDWGAAFTASCLLPGKIRFNPSYNWSLKRGYGEFGNVNENILDVTLSREFSWKKYGVGTVQLAGYDLLQSRKQLSRNIGVAYIQNTSTTTLGSYFLCNFIYNFNAF